MFNELIAKIPMEVRSNSKGEEYLEGVVQEKDLYALNEFLTQYLGHPYKKAGKPVAFSGNAKKAADSIGGLRDDQTFYFKETDEGIFYAALWPWQSDHSRITLKAGIVKT
jgi:hypothetical protein